MATDDENPPDEGASADPTSDLPVVDADASEPGPDPAPADAADAEGSTETGPGQPVRLWDGSTKIVAGVALGVTAVAVLYLARNALSLIALSGLIAFLVAPIIRLLQRRLRFPKALALVASYLIVLVGVLGIGLLVVDGVVSSVSEVDPPKAAESLRTDAIGWLDGVRNVKLGGYEVDLSEAVDPIKESLEESDPLGTSSDGTSGSDEADSGSSIVLGRNQVETLAGGLASSVRTVGGFILAALASALVTFLVAIYLSADSHKFHRGLMSHVPYGYESDASALASRFGQIWRGYLYGQLANSTVTGLLVWFVLWAIGLPGAFVLGLLMALLNMIPTFGPIIAAVPGVLAALALGSTRLDWSNLTFALLVVLIYVVVVQLQANLMAPFITGRAVQMSPATILVGLLVGFQVGGLVGSLLVVPVLATGKEAGRYVMAKLLDRDPFPASDPESDTGEESDPEPGPAVLDAAATRSA